MENLYSRDDFTLVPIVFMKAKNGENALINYKEKKFKVCRILKESKTHYMGDWMDNSNLFQIRFNKENVKRLTISEMLKLNKFGYDLVDQHPKKLAVIKNYLAFILFKILFFISYEKKIKFFKLGDNECGM